MPASDWPEIDAKVEKGHQVASGIAKDIRFPEGTLKPQLPFFTEAGLDLSDWHHATLNLSISPWSYEIIHPRLTLRRVKWHPTEDSEDFSFFDCRLNALEGLVYYPHPETKPEHMQPKDVLEVLLPDWMPGISYSDVVRFSVAPEQMTLVKSS